VTRLGQERVAALAVAVQKEADKARAVRIVLDGLDDSRDMLFVAKVDIAHKALVAAALVAHRDAARVVAADMALATMGELLKRLSGRELLAEADGRHVTAGLCIWSVLFHTIFLKISYK
jgi:hypothetical protein